MPDQIAARHGLETFIHRQPDDIGNSANFSAEIVSGIGYLNLRGNLQNDLFIVAAEKLMGQRLPLSAHTMSVEDHACYWLGPGEWLLATGQAQANELYDELVQALSSGGGTVSDLSGGYTKFSLSGAGWNGLLAMGCTLDLEKLRARQDFCVQCGLARATVLLAGSAAKQNIEIIVRRSFAEYVALWLQKSAGDAGIRFVTAR